MNWRVALVDLKDYRIELRMPNGQWFMGEDEYKSAVEARMDATTRFGLLHDNREGSA